MKKIIVPALVLLCFVVASHSCTSGNTDEQKQPASSSVNISIDSSNGNIINVTTGSDTTVVNQKEDIIFTKLAFLDSNLKYGRLANEMQIKMTEMEAQYYRTGNEKYYKLFFKYREKQWEYVGLCNRYNDSLTAN